MSLDVRGLVLARQDGARLLGPVDLRLATGERLGLVGESGSGKSLLVRAILGLLPTGVRQFEGDIRVFGSPPPPSGQDCTGAGQLGWMPQDPALTLNPLLSVAQHLSLAPRIHRKEPPRSALARLQPLLDQLRLPVEASFLEKVPYQLSGGQRQRLCLAMALSCEPRLLLLDEPTTALDTFAQRAFLDLVLALQRERGLGFLWITHDLGLAARACDRLLVLYGGHPVEAGPTAQLCAHPRHPYTRRLLAAARREPSSEAGFLGAVEDRPGGCPFQARCETRSPVCAVWSPWQGTAEEGCRCDHPLEPILAP